MNRNSQQSSQPTPNPSTPPPPSQQETTPFHQTPLTPVSPSDDNTVKVNVVDHEPAHPSSSSPSSTAVAPPLEHQKWGTNVMGVPAVPTCHPDNKKAALWGASADEAKYHHHPYVQYNPIDKPSNSPMESILHVFNSWTSKAESMANNVWHNLRTNSSVSEAAWGKMNLTAKAITGGGFEALYKQSFATFPNERLKKSFACYLSTSTGPVAGTLYLSDVHVAFCSDCPLSFTAPSGQLTWSYYKVMIPLGKISTINPIAMTNDATERYVQIVTVDGHDFWFMGFINYDKASRHLSESFVSFIASGVPTS